MATAINDKPADGGSNGGNLGDKPCCCPGRDHKWKACPNNPKNRDRKEESNDSDDKENFQETNTMENKQTGCFNKKA